LTFLIEAAGTISEIALFLAGFQIWPGLLFDSAIPEIILLVSPL